MDHRVDVAILGTGLFGAALAEALSRPGDLRVATVGRAPEAHRPDGTAASAGILSYQGWDPWDLALVRESVESYVQLSEEEGTPPVRRTGGIRIARTSEGRRWLERVERVLAREGIESHWLADDPLAALVPTADFEGVQGALFTPDDATFDASAARDAYLRATQRRGVTRELLAEDATIALDPGGDWRVGGSTPLLAQTLVVAAGATTKRLLQSVGASLPLSPFRAQVVRVRPRPLAGPTPTIHDLDLGVYVRPGDQGRLLVGDGTGEREIDPHDWVATADPEFVASAAGRLSALFPGPTPPQVESAWAGLCVASPDRFPLVGRVRDRPGLIVAAGFNGFGSMRAAGLAGRLAAALRTGRWEALEPSDPGRFTGPPATFDPRPEFPLEAEDPTIWERRSDRGVPAPKGRPGDDGSGVDFSEAPTLSTLPPPPWPPLSDWFDPLLPLFSADALRTGGKVEFAAAGGELCGLFLFGSSEGVDSGFTRVRRIAERYLDRMGPHGVYLEQAWRPECEPVEIFAADVRDWAPAEKARNPVRIGRPDDLPAVGRLMREQLGPGVEPWLATLPRAEETVFLCEVGDRVVGVSWLSRRGTFARGHSFVVHPRFRGLGIGTDLLLARMLWLQRTGGRLVVSEIYDGNLASRTAAERAGMGYVGRMFHFRPAPSASEGGPTRSGAPRTEDRPSPSSPSASHRSGTGP